MSRVPAENNNMSNRTAELPPLKGLPRLLRELRYDEFSRQGAGIAQNPRPQSPELLRTCM